MDMTAEIEESPGSVSSMRANLKRCVWTGIGMIGAGIALAGGMLILNHGFELVPVSVLLVTTGGAMIPLGLGAKAWQAQAEK
jgi:hypothetical protein